MADCRLKRQRSF
jgi:hypothetical protein